MTTQRPTLLLVDASNHFHRAYSAGADLTAPDGFPTGGLHSFFQIMYSIEKRINPDHVMLVFDKGHSFRRELFPDYKAQRPQKSQSFRLQWDAVIPLCKAAGYCVYREDDGYEADDVIATIAERYQNDTDVIIFSGDKDFAQLVNENISLLQPDRNSRLNTIGIDEVLTKYGGPENVVTYLALVGDKSDNIPGVNGVGGKFALKYISAHGDWQSIVNNAQVIGGKKGQSIADSADIINRAVQLITLVRNVPLNWEHFTLSKLKKSSVDNDEMYPMVVRYGLKVIHKQYNLKPPSKPEVKDLVVLRNIEDWEQFYKTIDQKVVVFPIFSNDDVLSRKLTAIGISKSEQEVGVVLLNDSKDWESTGLPLFDTYSSSSENNDLRDLVWKDILNTSKEIITHDIKQLYSFALGNNLTVNIGSFTDIMLLDYLDSRYVNHRDHSLVNIAQRLALYELSTLSDPHSDEELIQVAMERCHSIWKVLGEFTLTEEMNNVLHKIEIPSIKVIAEMEHNGIKVQVEQFQAFANQINAQLETINEFVFAEMGRSVNLNSPKQVATMLYSDRGLKPTKKTKSGGSTDSTSLQVLMETSNDPLLSKILEYREIHKIKSTYLEALPGFVRSDGRIHTHFHQTVTATGRLSSSNPNLQNIPVRKSWGKIIRSCFVASDGMVLLSADYSQIEMRILAHLCGEGSLVDAFIAGDDIHYKTALEIATDPAEYNSGLRTIAKAINYGLIYGMSAYRLAREINISREEATAYMNRYFESYPEVTGVLQGFIDEASEHGVAQTIYGRQRPVFNLDSSDRMQREASERIAMNAPIQGAAADIMKCAMCAVHNELAIRFPRARLLLQVHDELVIEAYPEDAKDITDMLHNIMSSIVELKVPLVVHVAQGDSWGEIH